MVLKNNGFEDLKKGDCTVFKGEIYDEKNNLVDQVTTDFYCEKIKAKNGTAGVVGGIGTMAESLIAEDSATSEKFLTWILIFLGAIGAYVVYKIIISNRNNSKK
jgi:hypothetical protein